MSQIESVLSVGRVEVPRQFLQLGVMVMDGSGSMTGPTAGNITKAQATNAAIRELFTRLKDSRVAKNFAVAVVAFDGDASARLQPTDVGPTLDDNDDYDPTNGHGGGTRIWRGLEEAERIVDGFLAAGDNGGVKRSAVILLMSDGECAEPDQTRNVATRIKTGHAGQVTICSTLFATLGQPDPVAQALLREVASDPVMGYKTVYDGETLRGFFERSLSRASGGVRIG